MTEPTEPVTTFVDFLRDHRKGRLNDELTAAMREVLEAVTMVDKGGSISLKLTIAPQGEGVTITHNVTATPPKAAVTGAFYFAGLDGMPSRRDPNQPPIPGLAAEPKD